MKLLVANRGEIAIRIIRAAAELNIATVAVAPRDDAGSLHTGKAEEAVTLEGTGTAAYLDMEQIIAVARRAAATRCIRAMVFWLRTQTLRGTAQKPV